LSYYYGLGGITVLLQDLQDFAWSAPMRDLAAKIGLSDVGLKKLLKGHGVVTPPQGYWNRTHAGRPVPKCPKVPPRGPGETGRAHLDPRFTDVLRPADPIPSCGPFASKLVPEDLEVLRQNELTAIGKVTVPRKLERVHHGLTPIFNAEQRRREKFASNGRSWDAPKFDAPVERRRLRILNAVMMTLGRRGHGTDAYERDGEVHTTCRIGDTRLSLRVDLAKPERGRSRDLKPDGELPAMTPLVLAVDPTFDRKNELTWRDDNDGTLERKVAEIAAAIIVAAEAKFRRGHAQEEERNRRLRLLEEKRQQETIEARNRERLKHLRESGELLRQASDLRTLIAQVRAAAVAGSIDVAYGELTAWEKWASDEADRLDPVLSGQIMKHLRG
jgi:hypothetical protein